jgi:exosortase/archaeosortase family protein
MIAFAALALLVAYLTPRGWLFKTALVLLAFPVAVLANLLRILLMSCITYWFGLEWIREDKYLPLGVSYHTAWGLLTMVVGVGIFLAARNLLERMFPAAAAVPSTEPKPVVVPQPLRLAPAAVRPLAVVAAGLIAALISQIALNAHLHAADGIAEVRLVQSLSRFPVSLGAWSLSQESPPDRATLPYYNAANDRLSKVYFAPTPSEHPVCHLWMVHFHDGSDRRHHPLVCFRVAGYEEAPEGHGLVPLEGQDAPARRFCFTRQDAKSYVYYWHYTLEPAESERLSYLQRTYQEMGVQRPSLTVQVFTSASNPGQLAKAEEFIRRVDKQLQEHLPPNARRGHETLPVKYVGAPRGGTPQ